MSNTFTVFVSTPEQRHPILSHIADLECRIRELEAENARLREALKFIIDAPEINPRNYDHDDVCDLNNAAINCILHARNVE